MLEKLLTDDYNTSQSQKREPGTSTRAEHFVQATIRPILIIILFRKKSNCHCEM